MKKRMRQIFSFALVIALLLSTLPSAAWAASELTISLDSPEAGSRFKVSWPKISGAEHYEYSAVDITGGGRIEIFQRARTNNTYFRIPADYMKAGHTYRVWVGAIVDGNYGIVDANQDTREFTVPSCSHRNQKEYIYDGTYFCRANNWETHETSYVYDYQCSDCGEMLTQNWYSYKKNEPHDFKSNGVCRDCGYEEECTHTSTRESIRGQQGSGKSISDSEHKITWIVYIICNGCDEEVDVTTKTETLPHQFDSNGDCTACDYRAACKHSKTKVNIEKTSYSVENETYHLYNEIGHVVCANASCGKEIEPYLNSVKQNHSFSGNTCRQCGYQKAEPLTVSVSRGQSSAVQGDTISASASVSGGSGAYNFAWKVYCNGSFVHETDYSYPANYSYTASQAGSWTFKVYVKDKNTGEEKTAETSAISVSKPVCPHSSTRKETTRTEKIQVSDSKHEVRTYYNIVCSSCPEILSSGSYDSASENHQIVNGRCECGYAAPVCTHSNQKEFIYEETYFCRANSDGKTHNIVYTYDYKCEDCGEQTTHNWYVYDKNFPHTPNSSNVCTECGYEPDCTHTNTRESIRGQQGSGKSISDSEHKITWLVYIICNGCDEEVDVTTKTETLPHQFDSNGDCTACDYRAACKHSKTKVNIEKTSYSVENETYHLYNEIGHVVCANASCGKEIEPYLNSVKQNHSFSGNTCRQCGYRKSEPLTVSVSRGQSSAEAGRTISASASAAGGSGAYHFAWKVYCNGTLMHETDYSHPSNYSYTASQAGSWTFKVYVRDKNTGEEKTAETSVISVSVPPCPHSSTKQETTRTKIVRISDSKHEVQTYYQTVCASCRAVLSAESYKATVEDHRIVNGSCVCGYVKPAACKHSSSVAQKTGSRIEQYDQNKHCVVTVYQDVCANSQCGAVLNTGREEKKFVNHSYNSSGRCECGHVTVTTTEKPCDHAASEQVGNPVYSPKDESVHSVTRTYTYRCECGAVNRTESKTTTEKHAFSGDTCTVCGYRKPAQQGPTAVPCDHKTSPVLISVSEPENANLLEHRVWQTYQETCACGQINRTTKKEVLIPHEMNPATLSYELNHESRKGHRLFYKCSCGAHPLSGGETPTAADYYGYMEELANSNQCEACRIMQIQTLLNQKGYNAGTVDGLWGKNSRNAMNSFREKEMGLGPIDYFDEETRNALLHGVAPVEPEQNQTNAPSAGECPVHGASHQYLLQKTEAHPHTRMVCACGYSVEGEVVESLTCCQCGYHQWCAPYHVGGGRYQETCMGQCGASREATVPAQDSAGALFLEKVSDTRKEISYVRELEKAGTSPDAPASDVDEYYIAIQRNGVWSVVSKVSTYCNNSMELRDSWDSIKATYRSLFNAEDIGITEVNIVGFELGYAPPGMLPNFSYAGDVPHDAISNMSGKNIIGLSEVSQMAKEYEPVYRQWQQRYTDWKDSTTNNSSVWLSVSRAATDKLSGYGYVLTNEALNTFSDPAGNLATAYPQIKDAITNEGWHKQKVDLWQNVLTDMLVDSYNESLSDPSHATANMAGSSINLANEFTKATTKVEIDPKIVQAMKAGADKAGLSDYIDWGDLGGEAYKEFDWGVAESFFSIIDAYYASTEASDKVKADQAAMRLMVLKDNEAIQSLQNIIDNTNDPALEQAAQQMIEDIRRESANECANFIVKNLDIIGESIAPGAAGIGAGMAVTGKNAANHYLNAALPVVGVVSNIASAGKAVLGWGASYESAQELMTYYSMDAELDAMQAISRCDSAAESNDIAQLWYSLQINGSQAAARFAKDYEKGLFQTTEQLGLASDTNAITSVSDLTAELNSSIRKYQKEAKAFADYCHQADGN